MAFTPEEEKVLKLMASETIARMKLNRANKLLSDEIHTTCETQENQIRASHSITINALQEAHSLAETDLLNGCK